MPTPRATVSYFSISIHSTLPSTQVKRWLVLSISLISLSALVPKSLYSCASGPEAEDYRFAAFLPFMHYKPAFATFNFCYPLYADVTNSAGIAADRERNISEWLKYMRSEEH